MENSFHPTFDCLLLLCWDIEGEPCQPTCGRNPSNSSSSMSMRGFMREQLNQIPPNFFSLHSTVNILSLNDWLDWLILIVRNWESGLERWRKSAGDSSFRMSHWGLRTVASNGMEGTDTDLQWQQPANIQNNQTKRCFLIGMNEMATEIEFLDLLGKKLLEMRQNDGDISCWLKVTRLSDVQEW